MRSEHSNVALQAIEFWSTICEEEYNILRENEQLGPGEAPIEVFHFAKSVSPQLTPILLFLMTNKVCFFMRVCWVCLSMGLAERLGVRG